MRHPYKMFALMPRDIATFATDARDASHSNRISALSCELYRLRLRPRSSSIVFSYSYLLRGHDRCRCRLKSQDGFAGRLRRNFTSDRWYGDLFALSDKLLRQRPLFRRVISRPDKTVAGRRSFLIASKSMLRPVCRCL